MALDPTTPGYLVAKPTRVDEALQYLELMPAVLESIT